MEEQNKNKNFDERPWGFYEVISVKDSYQVKIITVYQNKRLSLQSHKFRAEHWFIIKGKGLVTLDDKKYELKEGDSINIKAGGIHRIENIGNENLIFNEVQVGTYFGEEDIVRYEDDFGRI